MMVGTRRAEEVVDPDMELKPATRALLVALRCVDPDAEKRPTMGQVVRMLEAEDVPSREDRRSRRGHSSNADSDSKASSSEFEISSDRRESGPSARFQS
uniref:Pk8-a n=1 Tax=Arundo donax TaxID=35708 RepID=A0A0A9E3M6_ARUDO